MRLIIIFLSVVLVISCGKSSHKNRSVEWISNPAIQDSIFNNLITITKSIPEDFKQDSLAFLVLPIQVSCPACRKKTIDSIIDRKDNLPSRHFIIISANGGRKIVSSYFKEENAEFPINNNSIFLDSTNASYKFDLYTDKPTIYYAHNGRAYKRVAAIPTTVREDLREFFSGYRNK